MLIWGKLVKNELSAVGCLPAVIVEGFASGGKEGMTFKDKSPDKSSFIRNEVICLVFPLEN